MLDEKALNNKGYQSAFLMLYVKAKVSPIYDFVCLGVPGRKESYPGPSA